MYVLQTYFISSFPVSEAVYAIKKMFQSSQFTTYSPTAKIYNLV